MKEMNWLEQQFFNEEEKELIEPYKKLLIVLAVSITTILLFGI